MAFKPKMEADWLLFTAPAFLMNAFSHGMLPGILAVGHTRTTVTVNSLGLGLPTCLSRLSKPLEG